MKSMITTEHIFVEVQLKKIEKCFLGARVGTPKPVYRSLNDLDTSLTTKFVHQHSIKNC